MRASEFVLARIAEDEEAARDPQWLAFEYGVDSAGRYAFSARVLAECEAKRQIVTLFQVAEDPAMPTDAFILMREAVRALALPYVDHPDYDPAWRVER